MSSLREGLSVLVLGVFAIACSSGSGSKGGAPASGSEEALSRLSSSDRAKFDAWKSSLAKTCDAAEAFDGETRGYPFIDRDVFNQMTGGSALITHPDGSFWLRGDTSSPSGEGSTSVERSESTNGQTGYQLSATFKRAGGVCEAWLFGVKVHETVLWDRVSFSLAHSPSTGWSYTVPVEPKLEVSAHDAGLATLAGLDLLRHPIRVLAASEGDLTTLARHLGLSEGLALERFKVGEIGANHATVSVEGALPISLSQPTLVGPTRALESLTQPMEDIQLRIRVAIPGESPRAATFASRLSTFKTISPQPEGEKLQLRVDSVALTGAIFPEEGAASRCVTQVLDTHRRFDGTERRFARNPYQSTAVCEILGASLPDAVLGSPEATRAVVDRFEGDQPADRILYNGWDQLLSRLIYTVIERGEDPLATLDPESRTLVGIAASNINLLLAELANYPALADWKGQFVDLGIEWAFNGQYLVSRPLIEQIFRAVNRAHNPFAGSTEQLLLDLRRDPESQKPTLDFAQSLSDEYLQAGGELIVAGAAAGLDAYVRGKLERVLQERVTLEQLQSWKASLEAAAAFVERERAITDDTTAELRRRDVISRGFDESWTTSEYEQIAKFAELSRTRPRCTDYADVSRALAYCPGLENVSRSEGKLLDPKFEGRYGPLAAELAGYARALSSSEPVTADLYRGFFDTMWKSCGTEDFGSRRSTLGTRVKQLLAEGDQVRRSRLRGQIRELVKDCG